LACLPSCIATLVLLKADKHPIVSNNLINDLINKKEQSVLEVNKGNHQGYDNLIEYQLLQLYEKSTFYPWLFPFLFQDFDNVSINYDLLYNSRLMGVKDYDLKDIIAVSSNSTCLTVENFIKELDATNKVSVAKLMNIDNSEKLICYYYTNNKNQKSQSVKINNFNKLLVRSFLNSRKNFYDGCLATKFKINKPLDVWIDPKYFGGYNKYVYSLSKVLQ
jgi:hypothetical protein